MSQHVHAQSILQLHKLQAVHIATSATQVDGTRRTLHQLHKLQAVHIATVHYIAQVDGHHGASVIDRESKAWLPAHGNHEHVDGNHTDTASNGPLLNRNEYSRNRTKDYSRKTKESSRHSKLHTAWMPMYFTQAQSGSQF